MVRTQTIFEEPHTDTDVELVYSNDDAYVLETDEQQQQKQVSPVSTSPTFIVIHPAAADILKRTLSSLDVLATTAAAYIDKSLVLYSSGISYLPSDDEDFQNLVPEEEEEEEEDEIVLEDEAEDMPEDEPVHIFNVDDEEDQLAQTTTPTSFSS